VIVADRPMSGKTYYMTRVQPLKDAANFSWLNRAFFSPGILAFSRRIVRSLRAAAPGLPPLRVLVRGTSMPYLYRETHAGRRRKGRVQ
jgi:hypothetical protein